MKPIQPIKPQRDIARLMGVNSDHMKLAPGFVIPQKGVNTLPPGKGKATPYRYATTAGAVSPVNKALESRMT